MGKIPALTLSGNSDDVRTKMVLVAAKAAGVDLKFEAKAGVPSIQYGMKTIKYTGAMLRFVGKCLEDTEVYGNTFFESAEVDMWLDWSLMELEDPPADLERVLKVLEKHLDQRTFVVGQRFTLADVAASIPLIHLEQQGKVTALGTATKRWLNTCKEADPVKNILGSHSPPKTAQPVVPSRPAAASATTSIASTPLIDPYSSSVRGRTEIKKILAAEDGGKGLIGQKISVCGWVKTVREAEKGKLCFVQLNDGSVPLDIQVVIHSEAKGFDTLKGKAEKDGKPLPMVNGKFDYSKDFFQKPAFLTVSGQLSVENYCCSLSKVYTFGPTFRAENSHTSRHLAEFWMIEPELAFADIFDDMNIAEDYLKYCVSYAMTHNRADLDFFEDKIEKGLIKRLENLLAEPFARLTYTEAIDILIKESPKAGFGVPVEWGMDLGSEHERYLAEKVYKKPVILYNYPKDIKAFYMRLNEDNRTVAAMDVLAPAIGKVIGGSQREERLDVLDRRITEMGLEPKDYWWYRDLRRFGSVPHSGFGLGFERLIMLTTGVENIRDFEVRVLAMAAVTLASKLQEHPRKVVEVIQVFYRLKMREVEEEDGSASYAGKPTPLLDPTKKELQLFRVEKEEAVTGDVYFLAVSMGICEVIEDEIKRISSSSIHLESGRRVEVDVILKLYGFNGNFDVDRLMNVKTMTGFWRVEDFRRYLIAEPIGVNATNFGGTSFSPGVDYVAYFLWYPKDWANLRDCGLLPKHSEEPEYDRPAYVIDARHGTQTGMGISASTPAIGESHMGLGMVKRQKQLECHPTKKFLAECSEEWAEYGKKFKELGAPFDCPPYPYTLKFVEDEREKTMKGNTPTV
eukprot:g12976.t1